MRILNSNTLIDISKHSDSVIKLADFINQSQQKIFYSSLATIDESTSINDVLTAFDKDLIKTVSSYEKIHSLLSTVNENHVVERLNNTEKNLRNIFKSSYNEATYTVHLPLIDLNLKAAFDKEAVRDLLITKMLDTSYKDFKKIIRKIDDIYKIDENTIQTKEDAIHFIGLYAERKKYEILLSKIKNLTNEFSDYREKTSNKNKTLIDNEITLNRAMIDSVIQNSTYFSKEEGLAQISNSHKKEFKKVENIYEKYIKQGKYLTAIEIDPDVSLDAITNVLDQLQEDINLNITKNFVLKFRKLGNYNANGLYMSNFNIVACDIKEPSALIHELTHLVDISNTEIYQQPYRNYIINKYKDLCDLDLFSEDQKKKSSYYFNDKEIIARLGEIAYLLIKYNYQNESFQEFTEKVKTAQEKDEGKNFRLVKKIDHYINNEGIFFGFKTLTSEHLNEIKNYYSTYFANSNENIKEISYLRENNEKRYVKKEKRNKKENIFKNSIYSGYSAGFMAEILDINKNKNYIDFEVFIKDICQNLAYLSRTEKKIYASDLNNQLDTLSAIADWASKQDTVTKTICLKNIYLLSKFSNENLKLTKNINKDYVGEDLTELHFKNVNEIKEQSDTNKGKIFLNERGKEILYKEIDKSLKSLIQSFQTTKEILSNLKEYDVLTYALFADNHLNKMVKENLDQDVFSKKYEDYLKDNLKALDDNGALKLIFINKDIGINIIKQSIDFLDLDYNSVTYSELKQKVNPDLPAVEQKKEEDLINKKSSKRNKKDDRQLSLF